MAIIATIALMITDSLSHLDSYKALCPGICTLEEKVIVPDFGSYEVDREHFVLFVVREGQYLASTTWRENPLSREPVAAVMTGPSSFVLYLPGEPFLIREIVPGSSGMYLL